MSAKILVVDDDPDILVGLRDQLRIFGFTPLTAETGERTLELVESQLPDLILLDLSLPHMSGLDVLHELAKKETMKQTNFSHDGLQGKPCQLPVIVMTAHGSIQSAVEAMKLGAYEFLTKPFEIEHLAMVIQKALERESLKQQVEHLVAVAESPYDMIIGESAPMQHVLEMAKQAADADATVLLLGETGTGKELFARTIHRWSRRHLKPFMVVNCMALQETLLESELFGHEKGAFTGADRLHKGRIQAAEGGTLFLDEIGDMPLALQGRLLRVLQDHEIQRVGGVGTVHVDVRFIAATNRDLSQAVHAKTFREDLYYRLNVLPILLPALRERQEDIPELVQFFLKRHGRTEKGRSPSLLPEALAAILQYQWPGNIRELENVIARAVVLNKGEDITVKHLGLDLERVSPDVIQEYGPSSLVPALTYHEAMETYSRALILEALLQAKGNKTKAAQVLGVNRTYLNKMIKHKHIQ